MPAHIYTEDIDETFGLKPRSQESDADVLIEARHEHDWVTKRIAVGSGVWDEEDIRSLQAVGITHVIDCRSEASAGHLYRGTGIVYFHCGTDDDGQRKPTEWFHRGISFAIDALGNAGLRKQFIGRMPRLLVHCAAGINRGPSMAFAILRAIGMPFSKAEAAIRRNRPIVGLRYLTDAERAFQEWSRSGPHGVR